MVHPNPFGREYTKAEWAASKRVGVTHRKQHETGPLIYAAGPYYPEHARQMANDWKLVADAMDREWVKELTNDTN